MGFSVYCIGKLYNKNIYLYQFRSFCDECAQRLRKERFLPWLLAALTLVSVGYCAGRARRPPPPPLTIVRRADSPLNSPEDPGRSNARTTTREFGIGRKDTSKTPVDAPQEEVYLCGARTKKGTPCSRRVHGPVRCWQHKGSPAMLPQQKLLVKG